MSISTLKTLFGYKAWANSELFALLATLPTQHAEQLHTCVRTLNHIYVVDRIFRAHLSGEPRPFDATNTKATPSLGQLQSDVEATDAWYANYVSTLTAPAWRMTTVVLVSTPLAFMTFWLCTGANATSLPATVTGAAAEQR